jgi:hypothetical protein
MSFLCLNFKKILAILIVSISCTYQFASPMQMDLNFGFQEKKSNVFTEELAERFLDRIEQKVGNIGENDRLFIKNKLKDVFANDALALQQDLVALSSNPKLLEEFSKSLFDSFSSAYKGLLNDVYLPSSNGMFRLSDRLTFSPSDKIAISAGLMSFLKEKAKKSEKFCNGKLGKVVKLSSAITGLVLLVWGFSEGYQLLSNPSSWPKTIGTMFIGGAFIVFTLLGVMHFLNLLPRCVQNFVSPKKNIKKIAGVFCDCCKDKKNKK